MGFNQNPHVEKATTAEQKAQAASDEGARTQAWFEAAHHWERAADREKNDKRAAEYRQKAQSARGEAEVTVQAPASPASATPPRSALN